MAHVFPKHLAQPDGRIKWHEKEIRQFDTLILTLPFLKGRAVAIDGGAYVGTWTWVMAHEFARVVAFEPTPSSYQFLVQNMQRFPHVECLQLGLGNKIGKGSLIKPKGMLVTNQVKMADDGEVSVVTIDSLRLPACNLIKLDLNGGDTLALYGAEQTLRAYHPVVIVEEKNMGPAFAGTPESGTYEFMMKLGYCLKRIIRPDHIYIF